MAITEQKKVTNSLISKVVNTYKPNIDNYDYRGVRNKTKFPLFVSLCKMSQKDLKAYLAIALENSGYTEIVNEDGYLYAKGDVPVLLTAHMDTVHLEKIKDFYEYHNKKKKQHIISSPQGIGGDDRCGIYMILEIIKTHKCSVLFCEDEEIGCKGSQKFCKSKHIADLVDMKYMIELDRRDNSDAVFYQCDSKEFTKFIEDNTGYKTAHGSCSDISYLAPAAKVAAVNFSCGYHNAHTTSEYVVMEEMFNTIKVVKKLLDVDCEQFEYVKKTYGGGYYGGYGNLGNYGRSWYSGCYDDYYAGYYGGHSGSGYGNDIDDDYEDDYFSRYYRNNSVNKYRTFYIYVANEDNSDMLTYASNAKCINEALGKFFIANKQMCYDDVFDFEDAGEYVISDGWFKSK